MEILDSSWEWLIVLLGIPLAVLAGCVIASVIFQMLLEGLVMIVETVENRVRKTFSRC
jgi:hypothetical protein